MIRLLALVLALAGTAALAADGPVRRGPGGFCAPYPELTKRLAGSKWAETRALAGMVGERFVWEWWMNGDTGTWTLLQRRADGLACILGVGEGAVFFEPSPGEGT